MLPLFKDKLPPDIVTSELYFNAVKESDLTPVKYNVFPESDAVETVDAGPPAVSLPAYKCV
jgi:hypothetical protein